jgi:glutathione S-transferase
VSIIILYGPAYAPFTEKVRRALLLKKLEFEVREPTSPEDYKRWSPRTGLLPVLEIDGDRIADSTDILYALDERYPSPPLLSPDAKVAEQQRQLEEWADESFLWYFLAFRRGAERDRPVTGEGAEPRRHLPRFLRRSLAWLRSGGTWERPETSLVRGVGDRLDDLVNFLGGRPYFYGEMISMADLGVYSMLSTMRRSDGIPGSPEMVASRPTLVEFMRRLENETGG